ncbi:hypothetical protein BRD15_02555 [Halobacteriales archaeon SW_6_65_15]|nr:MAG: hypothetical protein BRD15_02555 [Halobacteriales archaeon SW_6_65_15]
MSTVDGDRPREGANPAHETCHDLDGPAALSETVIEAIATAEGVDPTDWGDGNVTVCENAATSGDPPSRNTDRTESTD